MSFEEEKFQFEDNEENLLPAMSLNKKIFFIGISLAIFIVICFGIYYGQLVLPGKRQSGDLYFRGIALYLLCLSGFIWIIHFTVQIIGSDIKDEKRNNLYFKRAYNYRIIGIILIILSYLIAFFSPNHNENEVEAKYKKEYKIFW